MTMRRRTKTEQPVIPVQPSPLPEMSAAARIRATTPPKPSRATSAWGAFTTWLFELTDRIEARKRAERTGR